MSATTTRTTDDLHAAVCRKEPVGRVVAAAVATGLVGALVLTLAVFAGASESTITGSALIAFGAGWAVLAAGTRRWTSQPQRWARVPAAGMAATGAAVVLLKPGEGALTIAGWLWPPALLALALWCLAQLRTAMTSRARWALYPLLAGLALASVGGWAETVALAHDKRALQMPGETYDIGGRTLHIACSGTGSPTVVLFNGTAEMSSSWARVTAPVAEEARVCAYDRAGQGWSDDAPHPQDGAEMARDLHALLTVAGEHGPYVLAGHSLGGVYAMTYAAQYPTDVAGLALLDSSTPEQFTALPDYAGQYPMIRRVYSVMPSVARLGVGRLVPSSLFSSLPQPAAGQVRAFETSSRGFENARDDVSQYRNAFRQATALHDLGGKPLVVVTATGSLKDTKGWGPAQDQLATLSTSSVHMTARTSHAGILDSPDGARAASDGIVRVVHASRAGS